MDIGLTLTAFMTMMAGFFAIAKIMLRQASTDREADRKERDLLTRSISSMAKASEKVARATAKSAAEAKERNGHLGEQSLTIASLVAHGNETSGAILAQLQDSAGTLAHDEHDKAIAVRTVRTDLAKS